MTSFAPSFLAATYLGLGGWCVIHPASVIQLCFVDKSPPSGRLDLALRCFGSQACLVGTMWLISKPKSKWSYAVWAGAMVPFIILDFVIYQIEYATFLGFAIDFAGNVAQIGVAYLGWKALDREEKSGKKSK